MLNLILNAAEAMEPTPAGQRRIVIKTESEDGHVIVSVTDSGPGIPHKDLERIFDSFYTSKRQGMGLGLAICRTVIESMRGRLRAENRAEGGATLRLTIPVADRKA
jgi:signal transduction histidine kinase